MNRIQWKKDKRPRRLRSSSAIRSMVRETQLRPEQLIAPYFLVEGNGVKASIPTLPDQYKYSQDTLLEEIEEIIQYGIKAIALFPSIADDKKDETATESYSPQGLLPLTIRRIKQAFPELLVISDVALDPYSSDGHDGVVRDGTVQNDETLDIMAKVALVHAEAGSDIISPSDMMDGRVAAIRQTLDQHGFDDRLILSYTAKYASNLYGPFRDALDSQPRHREGIPTDKQTYQMDFANTRESLRELELDIDEGADIVMVKPASFYLDIIRQYRDHTQLPIAAYQVSGEYAMVHFAAKHQALELEKVAYESLMSIRRAGADMIFTYFAKMIASRLNK